MKSLIGVLIQIFYLVIISLFFKLITDTNHIIGITIIIGITVVINIISIVFIDFFFKKYDLESVKGLRINLKKAISNAYVASSIISIVFALVVYTSFDKILELTNLSVGIINYTFFIAKIWFISSPFWGLELTIFKYYSFLDYDKKIGKIFVTKVLIWLILGCIFYFKYKVNCLIFAKPITDFVFLIYYTKICFDLTTKT